MTLTSALDQDSAKMHAGYSI